VPLEAVGVGDVAALERGQQVLPPAVAGAVVQGRLVDPEAGLAPDVQVADDVEGGLVFQAGRPFVFAAVAAAAVGQGPGDVAGVAVAVALVLADLDPLGQIQFDGDAGRSQVASVASPLGRKALRG
jgi:hypothetical protein